jgi:CTP:molybdopterin cytidylyltransferase MocA
LEISRVRTVVLGGGRSQRMGFDKLLAPFAGVPLARRVVLGVRELGPLIVTTPAVAETLADITGVQLIVTEPTAGMSETLALANAAVPDELHLAVLPCDVPFLDAARVRAFVARVLDDVDLAWPLVGTTPGHPVVWSPQARARISALRADEPPLRARDDAALRTAALAETDDAYVTDVDTPKAWGAAQERARRGRR